VQLTMVDAVQPDSIVSVYARHRKVCKAAIETLAVVKLELYFHDVYLTSATAFVYRHAQTYALVTSLHVLNGFNSNTQTYLDRRNFVPNKIEFYLNVFGDEIGAFRVEHFSVNLLRDGQPVWFESAVDSPVIDVALIELEAVIENFDRIRDQIGYLHGGRMLLRVDEQANPEFLFHVYPRIGSDVFILGFPKGIGQGTFPIWKKGSIATEPLYGAVQSGAPVILIDAVTRDGMSGSPVLYFGSDVAGEYGSAAIADLDGPYVVGVYAGREGVTPEENSMALSRVWKVELLDALFFENGRRRGKYFGPSTSGLPCA
jgi:hypothetical protein